MAQHLNNNNNSFYAGFRADDTLIEINPKFDYPHRLVLLSSLPVGPFQAGLPCTVPMWLALFLQQRSLGEVVWPTWLNAPNLADIVAYEKSHTALFQNVQRLPPHYYEGGRRLVWMPRAATAQATAETAAVSLLLQDLLEIRVDKLRQQFQMLLSQETKNLTSAAAGGPLDPAPVLNLMVAVTGIGTQELAILQPFVQQALNDQQVLRRRAPSTTTTNSNSLHPSRPAKSASSSRAEAPSKQPPGQQQEEEDTENQPSTDSAPSTTTDKLSRPRVPLRRFRK